MLRTFMKYEKRKDREIALGIGENNVLRLSELLTKK